MGEISGVKQSSHHDALVEDSFHMGHRASVSVASFLSHEISAPKLELDRRALFQLHHVTSDRLRIF